MRLVALRANHTTNRYTAKDFFVAALPALFGGGKRALGTIGFVLGGEGGGAWSVDLAAGTVKAGSAHGALVIGLSADDFARLLSGTLDVPAAMQDGRFTHEGDASLFFTLSEFLKGSTS
ncbi:MAG: SCP2 sterol-binding domain-containing protein [Deltaproteobacteria bacterium]|nr:SCP2 sterol-binding domain-containing protein [Deltaproteobacteria bacterium]